MVSVFKIKMLHWWIVNLQGSSHPKHGNSYHFPPYNIFYNSLWDNIDMTIFLKFPYKNPKLQSCKSHHFENSKPSYFTSKLEAFKRKFIIIEKNFSMAYQILQLELIWTFLDNNEMNLTICLPTFQMANNLCYKFSFHMWPHSILIFFNHLNKFGSINLDLVLENFKFWNFLSSLLPKWGAVY